MKILFYTCLISILIVSCDSKKEILSFSAFQIKNNTGDPEISVSKTGDLKIEDKTIGKILKDGSIKDTKGNLMAKLSSDNLLLDKNGNTLIKIETNGKMTTGSGVVLTWSEDGEFLQGTKKTGMRITPADKGSYQTASILLFLYLSLK